MNGAAAGVAIGERVGSFEILDVLGAGGMGAVFRARHATSGQIAALKMVRLPDHRLVASIRREIHALGQLDHPGIVKVLESGLHGGAPWYAMELVSGTPLRRSWSSTAVTPDAPTFASPQTEHDPARGSSRVAGAAPPLSSRAELDALLLQVRSLCVPLGYLHGEGLVHRDLKPDNVMLRADGSAVIIDFGLTSRFGGAMSRDSLEVGGLVVGTVLYMSPEQARGELVDARSDLYALGCILYELIAGRPPFLGTIAQVLRAHASAVPVPPSRHAAVVPRSLDRLVLCLLSKEPRDRMGYADDVGRQLGLLCESAPAAAPSSAARSYLYRPGFAGRAREVATLTAAIHALRRRQGAVVLVGGPSGIGKTRLMTEALSVANARRLPILTGQAKLDAGEPFELFRGPLLGIADRCVDSQAIGEKVLGSRGALLARYEPSLARLPGQSDHAPLAELPAAAARLRLYATLKDTLCALAEEAGLVMALDDLQWADELSLGFLRDLAPVAAGEGILVLATYRSDEVHAPLSELLVGEGVERLDLGNLDVTAVESIVRDMLAMPSPPERFSRFLWSQSEGSPFFVAEYLRAAVAHGLLWRDGDGAWSVGDGGDVASGYAALGMPRSIQELVLRRLAGIEGVASRLLDAASVLGREMPASLLTEVAGVPGSGGLEGINQLLARQVLEEAGAELRFVHDKIREVRHASMAAEARVPLHRAAAERLTALAQEDGAPRHAERAHHWEQCGEEGQARPCFLAAARAAAAKAAHDDAERHYGSYLRLATLPTSERVTALLELANEHALRGRMVDAEPLRRCAREEASTLGDGRLEVRAMNALGKHWLRVGEPARAREILVAALALAVSGSDRDGEATALGILGRHADDTGEKDEARRCYERQLAIRRELGDEVEEAEAARDLATFLNYQGLSADALPLYEATLEVARRAGDRTLELATLGGLAEAFSRLGRSAEALDAHVEGLELARRIGNRRSEAITALNLGGLLAEQGRLEEAIALSERALRILREIHDRRAESVVLSNLSVFHDRLGKSRAARDFNLQALVIQRELGDRRGVGISLGNLAVSDAHEGELDRACAQLAAAAALSGDVGDRSSEGASLASLAELLVLTGDHARADEILRQADAILSELRAPLRLGLISCARGHLALARGTSAAGHAAHARRLRAELGTIDAGPLEYGLARLARAEAALDAGQPLVNGYVFDDLPPAQQRWLRENRPDALP